MHAQRAGQGHAGPVTDEVRGKWTFYELDREALADASRLLHGLTCV